jgi:thymidylate synthase
MKGSCNQVSQYDVIYSNLVQKIIDQGVWDKDQQVRTKWLDGTPAYTKSIISERITLNDGDPSTHQVPLLTTKRVAWKSAIHELLWFYVHRTSDVSYLRNNKVKIWEEWTRPDNTIGKAYGYQLGKPMQTGVRIITLPIDADSAYGKIPVYGENQVQRLIRELKENPASRRHIISLWNIDDAWDMALQPCVWHNQWLVKEGKLHLIVGIRSNDIALGQPFNVFQYYVLQRMIAQVTGYEMGSLTFNINDLHAYERHIEGLQQQIEREPFKAPTLYINPTVKNFDDFTIKDFILDGYEHHETIPFEVAV